MSAFYIFDLDGTLADCSHRVPLILQRPKRWPEFFAACGGDSPIPAIAGVINALWRTPNVRVEIWSGRSDAVRAETFDWLLQHGMPSGALARMRAATDHRDDDVLKREWLLEERANGCEPTLVFEDRSRVVAMWRAEGVPCCQVAPGDF